MRYSCAIIAGLAISLGAAESLRAGVPICTNVQVSNAANAGLSDVGVPAAPDHLFVSFTTGAAPTTLAIIQVTGTVKDEPATIACGIYADNAGSAGSLLHSLQSVSFPAFTSTSMYFGSSGFALAANTTYWIGFSATQAVDLYVTTDLSEISPSGWTIGNDTVSPSGTFNGLVVKFRLDTLCPIDCMVSPWSDWSTCSATCGGGTQSRTRTVITPAYYGGAACPALLETQPCNTNPCAPAITSWKSIRTAGSLGEMGISLDPSLPIETASIEPRRGGVRIIEATLSAPVGSINPSQAIVLGQVISPSGVAGPELSYSPSSVSLVGGNRIRLTFADPLLPERARFKIDLSMVVTVDGDADCNVRVLAGDVNGTGGPDLGDALAVKARNGQPVTPDNAKYDLNNDGAINLIDVALAKSLIQPTAVDCVVSDWSAWSACSTACGGGTQARTRTVITEPAGAGAACPDLIQTQSCNMQPCPVDCVVSAWSAWSGCSKPCGGGEQTRTRTITTYPMFGGTACPNLTETQACNTQPCPVDCVVSAWSAWSPCSATCGGGTQTRTRTIVTPAAYGGTACPSNLMETQSCNEQPCP